MNMGHIDFEHAREILEQEYPRVLNYIIAVTSKPTRLIWDWSNETAATDCVANVRMGPWFYLEGLHDVADGTAIHEAGHVVHSPYGGKLMQRAHREGGEILSRIMNIIMDRKDDILNAEANPGFATLLRQRLAYICTKQARVRYAARMSEDVSETELTRMLKRIKPRDAYEDFFYAAKWHKRPRFRETHRAMKYLRRRRLLNASPDELLWTAKRVREVLGEPLSQNEQQVAEQRLQLLFLLVAGLEGEGKQLPPALAKIMQQISGQFIVQMRQNVMRKLQQHLKMGTVIYAGPTSVGVHQNVPVQKIEQSSEYVLANQQLRASVQEMIDTLVTNLRLLDSPSEFTLYGQDEGDELDLDEVANIIFSLGGYYQETVVERDIDAEIWLCLDTSGSMTGEKLAQVKQLVALFGAGITVLEPSVIGRVWSYDSTRINDYGSPGDNCGFVTAETRGGNSDTHMLAIGMEHLARSEKRQRVMFLFCDDGPDDLEEARKLSELLLSRGIIPIHIMVGVHGTPDIYPFELLFNSMDELLQEFGPLLTMILQNLK